LTNRKINLVIKQNHLGNVKNEIAFKCHMIVKRVTENKTIYAHE